MLREHPENWLFLRGRGDALLSMGRRGEAIADFEKAAAQQPKDKDVLNNLAWLLATAPEDKLRDGKRAVTLATQACELTDYKEDYILSTLAAAYAETGDFDNAASGPARPSNSARTRNTPRCAEEGVGQLPGPQALARGPSRSGRTSPSRKKTSRRASSLCSEAPCVAPKPTGGDRWNLKRQGSANQ